MAKHFRGDEFDFYSAGTETKPQINQDAVRLVKKLYGIDMEQTQYSKLISDIPDLDVAISMGCNVTCPYIGKDFDDNWQLDDPTGKSDEEFIKVINIYRRKSSFFEVNFILIDSWAYLLTQAGLLRYKIGASPSRHTNFSVQLFAPFHSAKIRTLSGCNPLRKKLKKIDIEFSLNKQHQDLT